MRKSFYCICVSIAAILFLHFNAQADPCFKMIDLKSQDDASFFAYSINANGLVVGEQWVAGQSRASL